MSEVIFHVIGAIAVFVSACTLIPQVICTYKAHREGREEQIRAISKTSVALGLTANILWLVYALGDINERSQILASSVMWLFMWLSMLYMVFFSERKKSDKSNDGVSPVPGAVPMNIHGDGGGKKDTTTMHERAHARA